MTQVRTQSLNPICRSLVEVDRDPANPAHWVPVLFPGLTYRELEGLMQAVDQRPYTAPRRLARPRVDRAVRVRPILNGGPDRDPRNPLHWMPLLPPAFSPGQLEAQAEAVGRN